MTLSFPSVAIDPTEEPTVADHTTMPATTAPVSNPSSTTAITATITTITG